MLASNRVGFAAKRLQILAQGFNPGLIVPKGSALKVAPDRCGYALYVFKESAPRAGIWCPFRARPLNVLHPGLKPWAKICNRFAVNIQS
jgi:hypothetical protein